MKPLVSIVILNYNQLQVTREFLDSCRSLTYPNYEIILVDNDSREDPTPVIREHYPHVHLIRTQKNLGFTGGNNVGIAATKGDYVFVVNNDTEVTPNLLEKLLEPFERDKTIGVVSPKIRYYSKPSLIQYAGYTAINPFTGRNKAIGGKQEDRGQHDTPSYTNYAHGAAMLVKREVIEKTGAFADEFFIYYEELDWSERIRRAGYAIYYQPEALIYHKESITMGKESPMKAYYHTRNRILFMRRNTKSYQFAFFLAFVGLFVIPKSLLKYTINRQPEHLRSFVRGLMWNFSYKPEKEKQLTAPSLA
ncbi:glycosyltransferase family 2 protein [Cesiribacter andamanensis]|uniref:dTDP-Rha:alpha-D-GlcNAc-pyrophosphate polyprenol, alpha-3-L-rhamnosyltransferase n=1 Tax=Cesiribacter andamanensis AMV16 TaxID=1279009 RepID=M7NX74_9BACT|nr:glycosyltransferase family 2 protein [Cesiribacter andamanensis]EMR03044.1 dTDP-Rha:alpha-D-GlcNAc-pyrophosphate polyprenol, alpha-3-L-rhamnosyltransferase [Cesiribacter andamanensis AMV16]